MRRKVNVKEDENHPNSFHNDEDLDDFVTINPIACEIQDGCQSDNMAVKRLVEKKPPEGVVTQGYSMEGGGEHYVEDGGHEGAMSPTKSTGHGEKKSVTDVKNWSDLMNTLSPKGHKNGFHDDPLPEMTKSDDDPFVDDLPLGSEANTLSAVTTAESSAPLHPPLDARLTILKASPGHPGWSSFHSEGSAQTTGSSANSLDILLSQRNVDPEHMLRSLGFGYVQEQEPAMLRVPLRFMQEKSCANGINVDEFLEEYPELQRLVMKKSAGWRNLSKSISTMATMKSLAHQNMAATLAAAVAGTGSPGGSHHGSNSNIPGSPAGESNHPEITRRSSILIPENQRALASQGFYDVPINIGKRDKKGLKGAIHSAGGKVAMDAASRRAQYQKAKSKRWSMCESTDDVPRDDSSDAWISKSLDESRGRLSGTDFSSSMDSSDSPVNNSRTSSISEKRRQLEEDMKRHSVEVSLCLPGNRASLEDDDDVSNYTVSPNPSKQNTIEKAPTLEETDSERKEEGRHVHIVVSDTDPGQRDVPDGGISRPKSPRSTQSLLSIVSAQIERLSDSGSDHTLVDSPRPSVDTEMSRPVLGQSMSKDSVFDDSERGDKRVSISCQTSIDSYHLDENDNHSVEKTRSGGVDGKYNQDDLPRMASIQSDSSGFGDADNTGELMGPEVERSWVSSLGSSSESAGTLASSNTTVLVHDVVTDMATQTPLSEHANNSEFGQSLTPHMREVTHLNSASRTATSEKSARSKPESNSVEHQPSRYISTVYIPPVSKTPSSSIVKQNSGSTISGKGLVLGKTRVSVIVPNKSQTASDPPTRSVLQKSPMNTLWTRRETEPSYYSVRAPLAEPEKFESDEGDGREITFISSPLHSGMFEEKKSEISVLNLSVADREFGSRISLAEESDYSCSSVADSTASCSSGEILDYRKLVRLINQPVNYRGRKQSIVRYRPKKQIRDWPNLFRKKRIQEETRLLQHAVQKYKTELHTLETSCLLQYQLAYEDLSEEEREEVEELQSLWREVRDQLQSIEQLLAHRMKAVAKGNDFFSFLSSLSVVHRMTELLKEQMYQQTVSSSLEQEQEQEQEEDVVEEDGEEMGSRTSFTHSSPHLADLSLPRHMSGYGSPFGIHGDERHHQDPHQSMEEIRRSLMDEMKQELNRSTQQLSLDMQAKDNEIQRLNLEMLMNSGRSPRRSRSSLLYRRTKHTDV